MISSYYAYDSTIFLYHIETVTTLIYTDFGFQLKKIASCKSLFIEPQQKHLVKCIWIITFYGWFTQNLILFSVFLASFLSHRYSCLLCSNRKSQNSLKRNQASKKSSAIRKKRNTRNILFPWRCENVSNRIIKTI